MRGFLDSSLAGDRGWSLRNDLATTESVDVAGFAVQLKPYVGYDIGKVSFRNGNEGGTLAGTALGVTVTVGAVSLDVMRVWSVVHTDTLEHESPMTFLKVAVTM